MQHIEYAYTSGMDNSEIEDRLATAQTGVLSLATGANAYAVPVAHYYDGTGLYFRLGRTEDSEKWQYIEQTNLATYTVYDAEPTPDPEGITSWSIQLTGRLREIPATGQERFDTAEINRRFAPIRVFNEPIEAIDVILLEFDIETMTGRTTIDTD